MSEVFLARQPILDRTQSVTAYELLYRDGDVELARVGDGEAATAQLALNALTEIGLDRVVGDHMAWINVTREFLLEGLAYSLPKKRVVLELGVQQRVDERLLQLISELRTAGYTIALDDFRYTSESEPLLGLVTIVKLDLAELGPEGLASEVAKLKPFGLSLVVEKVESHEDFDLAIKAGCDLFQGYFFCRPQLLRDRGVAPNRLSLLRLAAALQDPRLDLAELDRLISSDVALSYRLLRYINSAYFGLRQQVASVMHAVSLLGIENVRRWATLTTLTAVDDKPHELFLTALIRGRFCQQAGQNQDGPPAERFTLGLFSVLDALTDTTMETALAALPFSPRLRDALLNHSGPGRLLDCVQAIEQGHFNRSARQLDHAARHYVEALSWANDIAKELRAIAPAEVTQSAA
jgi:c-di-GMP phosphodiesterase